MDWFVNSKKPFSCNAHHQESLQTQKLGEELEIFAIFNIAEILCSSEDARNKDKFLPAPTTNDLIQGRNVYSYLHNINTMINNDNKDKEDVTDTQGNQTLMKQGLLSAHNAHNSNHISWGTKIGKV